MKNESHTLVDPPVEELLTQAGGCNFRLVALAAARARQINDYHGQLGQGVGSMIPPQVHSTSRKALSIAFEEIAAGKIVPGAEPSLPESPERHGQEWLQSAKESPEDASESPERHGQEWLQSAKESPEDASAGTSESP